MKNIFTKLFNTKQEISKTSNSIPQEIMSPLKDLSESQPQSQITNQLQVQTQEQNQVKQNNQPKAQSQPVIASSSLSSSSSSASPSILSLPQFLRKDTLQSSTDEIVIVNKEPAITKKEGHYYTKYKDQISKLSLSPYLSIERENMKVGFDKDIFDYLFNDLEMIFNQKSTIIESNQKTLIVEIEKTKELILAYSLLQRNTNASFDSYQKDEGVMNDIDQLEKLINYIDKEADNLLNEVNSLEEKVSQHRESK